MAKKVTTFGDSRPRTRCRVGLIIPSVNTVIEPDLAWAAPPELSLHVTRLMLRETTPAGLREMNTGIASAAELVAQVSPDVVAFACTSGTFVDGPGGLRELTRRISTIAGCPVVTTSSSMVEALRMLDVRRLSLATPYLDEVNEAEIAFLEGQGFEVAVVKGLGLSGKAIREVPPEEVIALARSADHPDSDALFISCTDFRALEVIDFLEAELGKPVLSSNQVTLWGILRSLGLPMVVWGCGRLLSP